jgi:hypothetical protein
MVDQLKNIIEALLKLPYAVQHSGKIPSNPPSLPSSLMLVLHCSLTALEAFHISLLISLSLGFSPNKIPARLIPFWRLILRGPGMVHLSFK